MERPLHDEPKAWRKLQTMAQKELNPKKLASILERMNRLLTAPEKQSLSKQQASQSDCINTYIPDVNLAKVHADPLQCRFFLY